MLKDQERAVQVVITPCTSSVQKHSVHIPNSVQLQGVRFDPIQAEYLTKEVGVVFVEFMLVLIQLQSNLDQMIGTHSRHISCSSLLSV